MPTPQELLKDMTDEAWTALQVTCMRVEGVDDVLSDPELRRLIEIGICYGTAGALTVLRDRGWLNQEAIDAAD